MNIGNWGGRKSSPLKTMGIRNEINEAFNIWKRMALSEKIMYIVEWRTVSELTGVFYKHKNTTRVSAERVRHESTSIILFLTRHNDFIKDEKDDDLYIAPVSHSLCLRSADDVSIDSWWRHNNETLHNHVNSDI